MLTKQQTFCKWIRCANNWQQGANPLKGCNLHSGLKLKTFFICTQKWSHQRPDKLKKPSTICLFLMGITSYPVAKAKESCLFLCPALPKEASMSHQLLLQNVSWSTHLSALSSQFKLPSSFTGYRLGPNWSKCSASSLSPWPTEYSQ